VEALYMSSEALKKIWPSFYTWGIKQRNGNSCEPVKFLVIQMVTSHLHLQTSHFYCPGW
jgi:hypothetical protein